MSAYVHPGKTLVLLWVIWSCFFQRLSLHWWFSIGLQIWWYIQKTFLFLNRLQNTMCIGVCFVKDVVCSVQNLLEGDDDQIRKRWSPTSTFPSHDKGYPWYPTYYETIYGLWTMVFCFCFQERYHVGGFFLLVFLLLLLLLLGNAAKKALLWHWVLF